MKKIIILAVLVITSCMAMAQQNFYMVSFTDKNDTQFDPYSYFDAKAIARYEQCGADLYDISNYPLNENYVCAVNNYASDIYGESRWLNAIGIQATAENARLISMLPFVKDIQLIEAEGFMAQKEVLTEKAADFNADEYFLTDQVRRFGGEYFAKHGIDGKGMRVCVMDGGFPSVDTHPAFKHLRDNNQIIATYNFPNKKEDVYGWNSHGTMVLSCIAGINEKGQKLGLATGAEFLLARTEIEPEPFKEEIWWAQGAEWADKNGANVINSSLGYGKERYWTKDMNGQSYVAKAANMAVEKGILICNSAGNEGYDKHWMTIITPADAENVICVAGIEPSLDSYRHISFSSYGPSADKRRKPDVCAFGEALVASPNGHYTTADGTSFASPLTAGFATCAWQTRRDLTALQMKEEILKSCDLYPYYDYAFGYGVPQAAYFTNELVKPEKSFNIVQEKDGIFITFKEIIRGQYLFISVEGEDGVLVGYYQIDPDHYFKQNPGQKGIVLKNKDLGQGKKVNVSYNGCYDSCPVSGMGDETNLFADYKNSQNGTFKKVKAENWQSTIYFQYDYNIGTDVWDGFNRHFAFGWRRFYGKGYKIGFGLSLDFNRFVARDSIPSSTMYVDGGKTMIRNMQFRGELLQRVVNRWWGVNWDLGVYGGINLTRRVKVTENSGEPYGHKVNTLYRNCEAMNLFECGAKTRISYTVLGMMNLGAYGSYRFTDIFTKDDKILGKTSENPSPWNIGLEIELTF